jgi:ATP-binding cassette subfamily F protein uup
MERSTAPESERGTRFAETLGRAGFEDLEALASALSGGWQKRLAIVEALVQAPDILLLDEPTNHLDLAGIEWLEVVLEQAAFACVVISHDRYCLENVANDIAELARIYPDGLLRVHGTYSTFLEKKEEFLHAQSKRQEVLENLVHSEIEWLRRGAKARTRKSKARIDKAGELMGELADLNARTRTATAQIDFSATDRKTKRLIELQDVTYEVGGRTLFQSLNFIVTAGMRVGLVGPNGSGKTTLLRLLRGELTPGNGKIHRADWLRIVYFDQSRELDTNVTLRRALAPEGDSVIYQDRVIHVASWAAKFLFTGEQLNQPVERLSGGERARVLIAQLMLQPADVLLLDEPTNDLDIPTLEILEESLLVFPTSCLALMDKAAPRVLPITPNGKPGRTNAIRLHKLTLVLLRVRRLRKTLQRARKRNSPTSKPANTQASSSEWLKPKRCCRRSGINSKIRRLPVTGLACFALTKRWKRRNTVLTRCTRAGPSLKKGRAKIFR